MTTEEWHWFHLDGLQAVSLYADPLASHSAASLQWMLPGFKSAWRNYSEVLAMKGMWSGDSGATRGHRPALDALREIDASILTLALLSVVEHGCAFMISATRDHGAICLTLLDGQQKHKLYPASSQELDQALRDLIESFDTTKTAPTPPRKAGR